MKIEALLIQEMGLMPYRVGKLKEFIPTKESGVVNGVIIIEV